MPGQQRRKPKARLITALIIISFIIVGGIIWGLNSAHAIQGDWSNWLSIGFIVVGLVIALVQWLFPLPSKDPPLSSNLSLIDAAFDPHDSPYEQSIEDGKTKIRYKGRKPKRVG